MRGGNTIWPSSSYFLVFFLDITLLMNVKALLRLQMKIIVSGNIKKFCF